MKMKIIMMCLCISICFIFTLSASAGNSVFSIRGEITQGAIDPIAPNLTSTSPKTEAENDGEWACAVINISVSCGGTYETQYCDEGLHGTLPQWIDQVDSWACD